MAFLPGFSDNESHLQVAYFLNVFFKLWVAKLNSHTHTCAHTCTCAMCVRKAFWNVHAMCVRATIFQVCEVRSQFRTFFGKKDPNFSFPHSILQVFGQNRPELSIPTLFSMLFHSLIAPEFELVTSINKKVKNLLQKFAVFKMCVCECALNLGKTHTWVRCACGPKIEVCGVRAWEPKIRRNSAW